MAWRIAAWHVRAPRNETTFVELDHSVLADATAKQPHGEDIADGADSLPGLRFPEVVVPVPARLLRRVSDQLEDRLRPCRDHSARAHDPRHLLGVAHPPIVAAGTDRTTALEWIARGTYDRSMAGSTELPVGAHACCRFGSPQQRQRVVAEYVAAGLARRERVAVFSQRAKPPAIDVTDEGFAEALATGQLLLGNAEEAYFPDGDFDGSARVAEFVELAREAVSAGYSSLRVYADNGGMPATLSSPDEWLLYEMRVAATIPRFRLTGLCGFSIDDPPALPADLIDAVHEFNVTAAKRPSPFHFRGKSDGSFELAGGVQQFALDNFRRLITAAAPVLSGNLLSLRELHVVDTAAAEELHRVMRGTDVTIWGVPAVVRHIWESLGLAPAN